MYQSIQGSEEVTETSSGSDSVLWLYAIFSKATATALALTTLSSLVLTIRDTSFDSVIAMVHLVLRIYSLIFMVIAFICEMEWLEQIRHSAVFQNWIFRGLFYSYLGLFSFVEYANFQIDKSQFSWVIEFIALVVFSSGVCYTLLGAFNCKKVKNERTVRYIQLLTQSELSRVEDSQERRNGAV